MSFSFQSSLKSVLAVFLLIFGISFFAVAQDTHGGHSEATEAGHEATENKINVKEIIFGHIRDSHDWHLFSIGHFHASLPLPVILYNPSHGLSVFMSSKFEHGHAEYNGYKQINDHDIEADAAMHNGKSDLAKGKIISLDGSKFYNFSITKNVLSMFISLAILWFLLTGIAKKYKRNGSNKAPSGWQNALEPVIGFIDENVAKPYLGAKAAKYMPLLLTFFFFIWVNNLLGLLPGGANLTGNITVTLVLTLIFFVVMLVNSSKYFWGHIFNPPGIPFGIKLILVPIEILSNLMIKPAALAIRLFANIFAGHTIILSLICMIFIFGAMNRGVGFGFSLVSVGFSVFMFFLELLVAAIQAFIFTNLVAVFIGQAVEEHHHEEHAVEAHH